MKNYSFIGFHMNVSFWLQLWLLSNLAFCNYVNAQTDAASDNNRLFRANKPYDTSIDWESTVVARGKGGCTFAPRRKPRSLPNCRKPSEPVSREVAAKRGVDFAPIIYQHPLDNSWLTDPSKWLDKATSWDKKNWNVNPRHVIQIPPGVQINDAGPEYLSSKTWFASRLVEPYFNTSADKWELHVDNGTEVVRKAVVDPVVNGRLTGKIYYTAFRPFNQDTGETLPYAWVYTYMMYYPWNGCSNQVIGTQVDGRRQGVEYIMCGDGAHEGDLEHVKVYVCEADLLNPDPASVIQRAQYSQHGWLPELDCQAGECNFQEDDKGQKRLVVYSALSSHANWAFETPLYVYVKIRLEFLVNMDGLYLGDRFKAGPVFYPDANNTQFLPFLEQMTPEQKDGEFAWATFPGVWGATMVQSGSRTITCLYDNFTAEGPCSRLNPAYWVLDVLLRPKGWRPEDMNWSASASGNTVTGPLFERVFSYNWEWEREAPLYRQIAVKGLKAAFDGYCPLEAPITTEATNLSTFDEIDLRGFLAAVTGLVLASSVIAFAMLVPALLVRQDRALLAELAAVEVKEEKERQSDKDKGNEGGGVALGALGTDEAQALKHIPLPPAGTTAAVFSPASGLPNDTPSISSGADPEQDPATASPPPVPTVPPPPVAIVAGTGAGPSRSLTTLKASHRAILRGFHASIMHPYLFIAWIFVGVALYICGVVLGAIGTADSVEALNEIVALSLWKIVGDAIVAAFIVFGVVHVGVIIASIFVMPQVYKRLCSCGSPDEDAGLRVVRRSWVAHAVLAGLLVIEMNVTMLMFAFGLILWVARFAVSEVCVAAVQKVFDKVMALTDICLDLSVIGLSSQFCLTQIADLCNLWSGMRVDYLSFGCMLFLVAQSMFLVLAACNYTAMRSGSTITTVMRHTEEQAAKAQKAASKPSYSTLSIMLQSRGKLASALKIRGSQPSQGPAARVTAGSASGAGAGAGGQGGAGSGKALPPPSQASEARLESDGGPK